MVLRLLVYLVVLAIGWVIGLKNKENKKLGKVLNTLQNLSLLFLLFIMGMRIGLDKKVIESFYELGFQGTVIALFSIFFSILLVKATKGYILSTDKKEVTKDEC